MHYLLSAFAGSAVHPASMPKNNASDFEGSSTGSLDSEDVSLEL